MDKTHVLGGLVTGRPMMLERKAFDYLAISNKEASVDAQALDFSHTDSKQQYIVYEGIAIISIHGPLSKRSGLFDSFFGFTSYEALEELISQALNDSEVQGILLDIDSPGGEVAGLFDFADKIYTAREIKPIWAVANEEAYSAAYAIASAAKKIFVTRTGGVGSIGVIANHIDQSSFDEKLGVKYTTIFAGNRKNDFNPHEQLTSEAEQVLQKEVDRLYGMFADLVSRNRSIPHAKIKNTEAALFFGEDALSAGLADSIMTLPEALESMIQEFQPKQVSNIMTTKTSISEKENPEQENSEQENTTPTPEPESASNTAPVDVNAITSEAEAKGRKACLAEIAELSKACELAGMPDKLSSFIERAITPEQAKDELMTLLANKNQQPEIHSQTSPAPDVKEKNPVLEAAEARAEQAKQSKI
tara:strand:+ start:82 stop:1335 length:1254 start_codon:yes stop_codon:yes gene_type:complete